MLIIIIFIIIAVYFLWGNLSIATTKITVRSSSLPSSFDGFKIVHISDLHNDEFGDDNQRLLSLIRNTKPDIIALTGDIIDSRRTDTEVAEEFIEDALKIAPVYYSTGNHESRLKNFPSTEREFIEDGAIVLRNEAKYINKGNHSILIAGIDDPDFKSTDTASAIKDIGKNDAFTVLLSHRPELFDIYCKEGIDLTLSGHAHGGQFRLPFIGGIYAPHQGLMPEYTEGLYTNGSSNMIVSRGLGKSLFPIRFNNRPEIVVITLETK
ncbi:MAG: metallophosphoesterase [Lachnospiraceae bacterium]|nr:metallophosphoesterase [Lachnospiraceae bacterium]